MSNQKRTSGKETTEPPHDLPPQAANFVLPQTGWFADWQWAQALGQTRERFRELVRANGVPHRVWGYLVMVRAEDFYDTARWNDGTTTSQSAG